MRDRRARVVMIGLILAFPLLMVGASRSPTPGRSMTRGTVAMVLGLEAVLGVGLVVAGRERRRLLSDRAVTTTTARDVPSLPHGVTTARRPATVHTPVR